MKFAHILSRLKSDPWFITPGGLEAITDLLEARLAHGARFEVQPARAMGDGQEDEPAKPYEVRGATATAVVKVNGILGQHLSLMEQMCGGVDYGAITSAVQTAMADPQIARVVMHINSRGGTARGCAETFAALRQIRAASGKPLITFCDGLIASAGIYVAAASDAIFCTESAELGCIGSMLKVEDRTEANAKAGIKRFVIKSASMKDVGNPDRPMTEEERTYLQGQIDYLGGLFVRDFKAGRAPRAVAPEVFETGLTWFGPEAVSRGLADGVVGSLDELLASLS